eukprot:scaffold88_cov140-Isochrysis_galbana.AAC.2
MVERGVEDEARGQQCTLIVADICTRRGVCKALTRPIMKQLLESLWNASPFHGPLDQPHVHQAQRHRVAQQILLHMATCRHRFEHFAADRKSSLRQTRSPFIPTSMHAAELNFAVGAKADAALMATLNGSFHQVVPMHRAALQAGLGLERGVKHDELGAGVTKKPFGEWEGRSKDGAEAVDSVGAHHHVRVGPWNGNISPVRRGSNRRAPESNHHGK